MEDVFVDPHAYKHGLTDDDILYAWDNFLRRLYRGAPNNGQILAIGCDRRGRLLQLVAVEKSFGVLIYHAMTPPTNNALIELGIMEDRK